MDVSNTGLILAVQLLNVNHLFCPGWVRDTAPFSAQYVNENHVLTVLCDPVPLRAGMIAAELNWTEKGTNQSMKWSCSLRSLKRFVRSNDTFVTDTTLVEILSLYLIGLPIFIVPFFFSSVLGTYYFQSLTTGKIWIHELHRKQKWKLKIALAAVSDPAVCVLLAWRQVPVYMCWPNHNTWWRNNSSRATNRRPADQMRPGGRLLRTTGRAIAHHTVQEK